MICFSKHFEKSYNKNTYLRTQEEKTFLIKILKLPPPQIPVAFFLCFFYLLISKTERQHLTRHAKISNLKNAGENNSPILQVIEWFIENIIIPLIGRQLIGMANYGKGVDQVCAEVGIYVGRQIFSNTWSILGPVCEVAHQFGGGHFWRWEKYLEFS